MHSKQASILSYLSNVANIATIQRNAIIFNAQIFFKFFEWSRYWGNVKAKSEGEINQNGDAVEGGAQNEGSKCSKLNEFCILCDPSKSR